MKHKRLTPAFTMLELIFVIAILGVVASLGSEMIVKIYDSYIVQRAQHRATLKTQLAATQIANRLASAIPGTVYRIRTNNNYEPIDSDIPGGISGDDYKGIQWVGADTESFSATATPGWSGFCDIDGSSTPTISTPGSNLNSTANVISNLAGGTFPSFNSAVYFPYDITAYPVTTPAGNTLTFTGTIPTHIVEHYKLAWTSYALIVDGGDLYLYYNFDPTAMAARDETTRSLLMKNISTFKFKGAGRTIRFKICKQERISADLNITSCKEKAVF
ncbi:MAG: prepilin-type cleavage/methylation domain-containing protein [Sulfurovum sp.]|nr:MAG: prepilin-type cleavage/methylation domain-containing protein [Sulfurovum sp.]